MLNPPKSRLGRRRFTLLLIGIGVLVVLLAAAADGLRLQGVAADLKRGSELARQSSQELGQPQEWNADRIAKAKELNRQAIALVAPARTRIHDDPGLGLLSLIPRLNDQTRTAQDLADALLNSSRAETDLIEVAQLYVNEHGAASPIGARLLNMLSASAPLVANADGLLQRSLRMLRHDLSKPLAGPVRTQVSSAVMALEPIASNVATLNAMSRSLPSAVGANGPRKYLLLLQNPGELRPAGGFSGYLGPISFANGEPGDLQLRHHPYYSPLFKQCFAIPAPLVYYLTFYKHCLELGDAGWSADFPTASRLMEQMYTSATGEKVDGTIAIDPYAVAQILKILGPVNDPVYGEFTSENFFAKTNEIANVKYDEQAIQPIGKLILAKLTSLPLASWPALATALAEQGRGRHVQLSMHDTTLSSQIAAARLNGAILDNGNDDYLMVIDANMHMTKSDLYMKKTQEIKVEIYPSGLNRHLVTLRYEYPKPATPSVADEALNLDGRYINYARIYLPDTANMSTIDYRIDGIKTPMSLGEVSHEFGKTVVGITFILDRGHTGELSFLYSDALRPRPAYSLYVQKQAGIPDRPITLEVSYPGGIAHRQSALAKDENFLIEW